MDHKLTPQDLLKPKPPVKRGRGRPKIEVVTNAREKLALLKQAFLETITYTQFRQIIRTAIQQAKKGDAKARDFLIDRLFGKVPQTVDANVQSIILTPDQQLKLIDEALNINVTDAIDVKVKENNENNH